MKRAIKNLESKAVTLRTVLGVGYVSLVFRAMWDPTRLNASLLLLDD